MESSFGGMTYKSRKQALQFGGFFAEQMGCGDADAADALACMRNASSDAVKAAWVSLGGNAKKIAEMVIDWQNLAVALTFTPAVLETDEWYWLPLLIPVSLPLPPPPPPHHHHHHHHHFVFHTTFCFIFHQAHATQRSRSPRPHR
jgi:hypothetical protein